MDRLLKPSPLFASEAKHNPPETRIQYCDIEAIAVWMPLDEPSAGVSHVELLAWHRVALWNGRNYLCTSRGKRGNEGVHGTSRQSYLANGFGRRWQRNDHRLVIIARRDGDLKVGGRTTGPMQPRDPEG